LSVNSIFRFWIVKFFLLYLFLFSMILSSYFLTIYTTVSLLLRIRMFPYCVIWVKYFFLISKIIFEKKGVNQFLKIVSKWSMLDVFVIAVLIVSYKIGEGFIKFETSIGLVFYTISIITCSLLLYKEKG